MDRPNGIMGWALAMGLISVILILVNHYLLKGDRNATAYNYGVTDETEKLMARNGKSLLLVFAMFAIGYYVLCSSIGGCRELRVFEMAFRLLTPERFLVVLQYLIHG